MDSVPRSVAHTRNPPRWRRRVPRNVLIPVSARVGRIPILPNEPDEFVILTPSSDWHHFHSSMRVRFVTRYEVMTHEVPVRHMCRMEWRYYLGGQLEGFERAEGVEITENNWQNVNRLLSSGYLADPEIELVVAPKPTNPGVDGVRIVDDVGGSARWLWKLFGMDGPGESFSQTERRFQKNKIPDNRGRWRRIWDALNQLHATGLSS